MNIINNLKNFIGGMPVNNEIFDNYTLIQAVDLWISNRDEAISQYGDINTWNVSQVTDMS